MQPTNRQKNQGSILKIFFDEKVGNLTRKSAMLSQKLIVCNIDSREISHFCPILVKIAENVIKTLIPGGNSTIVSYNAGAVKISTPRVA
jgi:hypothetical protein